MNQPPTQTLSFSPPVALCSSGTAPELSGHRTRQQGKRGCEAGLVHLGPLLVDLLSRCPVWRFILRCHLLSEGRNFRLLSRSSSARRTPAGFSSTPTGDRTGHTAPQCPLFVGVCQWWRQAKDQEAALRPSGGPLGRPDDSPPSTLFPQTQ